MTAHRSFIRSAMSRRELLHRATALGALSLGGWSLTGLASHAEASDTRANARLVLVILRGAMDGLAAVAPYGDSHYASVRGALALSAPGSDQGALKLDGLFALHPALRNLYARYQVGELLPIHAVASPYRERSHFDGQDLLENGTSQPHGALDGWLNRALVGLPASSAPEAAIALAQNIPLVLRGPQRVGSWVPSRLPETDAETLQRLMQLYADDEYFLSRLQTAVQTDALVDVMADATADTKTDSMSMTAQRANANANASNTKPANNTAPRNGLAAVITATANLLSQPQGPRIAVLESTGWDTHANQGAEQGLLAGRLSSLDQAVEQLRMGLGSTWRDTVVMMVTEFGRTVAVNGTRGTDHGTASVALLAGGAVAGGRVAGDWPGLAPAQLYQGRDLMPTTDLRSVFKGVLRDHLGVAESLLETRVFADSRAARPLGQLIRT